MDYKSIILALCKSVTPLAGWTGNSIWPGGGNLQMSVTLRTYILNNYMISLDPIDNIWAINFNSDISTAPTYIQNPIPGINTDESKSLYYFLFAPSPQSPVYTATQIY